MIADKRKRFFCLAEGTLCLVHVARHGISVVTCCKVTFEGVQCVPCCCSSSMVSRMGMIQSSKAQ